MKHLIVGYSALLILVTSAAGQTTRAVADCADARAQIKRQALLAATHGDPETRLSLTLPVSAADAGQAYLAALDEADNYARVARLLSLETPAVHRVFRHWYVGGLVTQLRARAAGDAVPAVQTFSQRLADEVAALAPLRIVAEQLRRDGRFGKEQAYSRGAGFSASGQRLQEPRWEAYRAHGAAAARPDPRTQRVDQKIHARK